MPRREDVAGLLAGIGAGERLALARALTLVERAGPLAHTLLKALFPRTGRAHIVGITGAPGTGKSTLVNELAKGYRRADLQVAIVAIDPTSPFSGGALLGDRVRMRDLAGDAGIFMRSMATRGSLGGLGKATADMVLVLDAAGFDRILVETVGVGQAEVEIVSTAHTTLVVEAPGMGDEVQAIKAGILEIGDILVVNKADREGADRTVAALEMMLHIADGPRQIMHHGGLMTVSAPPDLLREKEWTVQVLRTTAARGEGIVELLAQIDAHLSYLQSSGEWSLRERMRTANLLENIVRAELNRRILAALPTGELERMVEAISQRQTDPYTAADTILGAHPLKK